MKTDGTYNIACNIITCKSETGEIKQVKGRLLTIEGVKCFAHKEYLIGVDSEYLDICITHFDSGMRIAHHPTFKECKALAISRIKNNNIDEMTKKTLIKFGLKYPLNK